MMTVMSNYIHIGATCLWKKLRGTVSLFPKGKKHKVAEPALTRGSQIDLKGQF
jgi:hypothetical protein